eukprot:TRINITY_DN13920_c0_g1_i3.p1 TRINITY_DN13920_c0_g1~~TRINITY_DN13920_c0_g1_i3.p1  ORF type:complete len:113 (+),score=5.58 TRINITY_DN13920_c0_g1_i3:70-408(+)
MRENRAISLHASPLTHGSSKDKMSWIANSTSATATGITRNAGNDVENSFWSGFKCSSVNPATLLCPHLPSMLNAIVSHEGKPSDQPACIASHTRRLKGQNELDSHTEAQRTK